MARILCIETATHLCSVAICSDGRPVASRDAEERDRFIHAERLNVMVEEVMQEAGWSMSQLDAVAVGIGPGSYTGLRIGLSAAKGFCYALGIPIIGVGTLGTLKEALLVARRDVAADAILFPMIDARRMEVFSGDPVSSQILDDAWIDRLDRKRHHVVFGDGADKAAELWRGHAHVTHVPGIKPYAAAMAVQVSARAEQRAFDDLAYLVPIYGKEPAVMRPGTS